MPRSSQHGANPKIPRVLIVIPARYASTRLPGKPLADIHGKPMIQWVYEQAKKVKSPAGCVLLDPVIATDDERIRHASEAFGGQVVMTSPDIQSGTDRMAAVADQVSAEIYVNIQGDEPLIDPDAVQATIDLVSSGRFPMGTAMTPLKSREELHEPSVVKVIADDTGRAIYFSRFAIPYSRGPEPQEDFVCMRHVGLYVFTRETLMKFRSLPPSPLERAEVLEQLRALANGIPIGIVQVAFTSIGVDTPEDLEKVMRLLV